MKGLACLANLLPHCNLPSQSVLEHGQGNEASLNAIERLSKVNKLVLMSVLHAQAGPKHCGDS